MRFLTPDELADFVVSDTPKAERLRQSSPLVGILTEAERRSQSELQTVVGRKKSFYGASMNRSISFKGPQPRHCKPLSEVP